MWLLHSLFLDAINADCAQFCVDWNAKPITGQVNHRSPNDLRFIGQTANGVYVENLTEEQSNILAHYLEPAAPDIANGIEVEAVAQDNEHNFNHEAVDVPESEDPFATMEEEQVFWATLAILQEEQFIPEGYGLLVEESEDEAYPVVEILQPGRRGRQEITISLPEHVWRPRAELWGRAIDLLVQLTEQ
ncbi:hypothetical protein BDY19DRAFT_990059 [Irpex rosettiformis]|uniref:Uncharacterized protein n=1 Tax=Irpex rosettiformis TaxID=378272 RepID=A0ACB8UGE8_9APHY|nr:hypothetical protein BDY19DRAFT_990059 [Irpex rosettiformis]